MKIIRIVTIIIVLVAAAASSLPFVVPSTSGSLPKDFESAAALTIFFAILGIGAALLFGLGLSGFKTAFRKSYAFLCAGLTLHGLGMMAFPIIIMYTPFFRSDLPKILGDLPYLVGTVLIYLGLLYFARLLELKTKAIQLKLVLPAALGIALLTWLLPHVGLATSDLTFDLVQSILWFECIFSILSLVLIVKLRRTASLRYTRPLSWLLTALVLNSLAGLVYVGMYYFLVPGEAAAATVYELVGLVYALTNSVFMIAGYSFNRLTRAVEQQQPNGTIIDVLIYMAGLASQPRAVEPLMDPLRVVTASYVPGRPLTDKSLAQLAATYENVESYLITKEPLRKFTRDDLRRSIQHKFAPETYGRLFKSEQV